MIDEPRIDLCVCRFGREQTEPLRSSLAGRILCRAKVSHRVNLDSRRLAGSYRAGSARGSDKNTARDPT